MMLREVEDLSFFSMGSLKLNRLFPSIEYGKQYLVYNMCDDIYVNFMPLKYFYENEVKKQNQPNIFWRDTSVTHYKLGRTGSKIFVDGDYYSDLPQYHSVSIVPIKVLGLKLEINLIVDVNGGWHASISGGIGEAYGVSYTESYMCNSAFGLGNCNSLEFPSLDDVTAGVNGLCAQAGVVSTGLIKGGVSIAPLCLGVNSSPPSLTASSVATYYAGDAQVGFSLIAGNFTFPLLLTTPSMGWKDSYNEIRNGIHSRDVKWVD